MNTYGVTCENLSLTTCTSFFRGRMSQYIDNFSTFFDVEFFICWNMGVILAIEYFKEACFRCVWLESNVRVM